MVCKSRTWNTCGILFPAFGYVSLVCFMCHTIPYHTTIPYRVTINPNKNENGYNLLLYYVRTQCLACLPATLPCNKLGLNGFVRDRISEKFRISKRGRSSGKRWWYCSKDLYFNFMFCEWHNTNSFFEGISFEFQDFLFHHCFRLSMTFRVTELHCYYIYITTGINWDEKFWFRWSFELYFYGCM